MAACVLVRLLAAVCVAAWLTVWVAVEVAVTVALWDATMATVAVTVAVPLGPTAVSVLAGIWIVEVPVPDWLTVMVEVPAVSDCVSVCVTVLGTWSNTNPCLPMPENSQRPGWPYRRQKRSPFSQSAPTSLKREAFSPGSPCIDSGLSTTMRKFGLRS